MSDLPSQFTSDENTEGTIQVRFDADRKELTLLCSADAFSRLRDAALPAGLFKSHEIDAAGVSTIEILDLSQFEPRPNRAWRDRVALLGCAFICVVISLVLLAGVLQIVTWIVK